MKLWILSCEFSICVTRQYGSLVTNNNFADGSLQPMAGWRWCPHYVLIPIEISVCAGGGYKDVSHTQTISLCIAQYIIMACDSTPLQGSTYLELYLTPYLLHTGALYRAHTISYHIKVVQMSRMGHSNTWAEWRVPTPVIIHPCWYLQHLQPWYSLDIPSDINKALPGASHGQPL